MKAKQNLKWRARWARAMSRGVTLVEILIVLAIVGMIAGGVAVYAVPKFKEAAAKSSKIDATTLQPIADKYRGEHPGDECPTVQMLKDKKEISGTSKILDAWDHPYLVECEADETYIRSWGPDGKANTEDDIVVPERRKE
jgi:general secretion pathway protein G